MNPLQALIEWIQNAYGSAVKTIQETSSDYEVTLDNGEVLSVNASTGEITIVKQGNGPSNPLTPGTITPNVPFVPPDKSPLNEPSTVSGPGGMQPFDLTALKWLGALVLLWIILTALSEYSPNTALLAKGMAGLILLSA